MKDTNFNNQYKNAMGAALTGNNNSGVSGHTAIPGSHVSDPNGTGAAADNSNSSNGGGTKPFWETGFGQFLMDFSGVGSNGNNGPHPNNNNNNTNNNNYTDTNNACLAPNTMISGVCMPPPKKSYLGWYIAGGVAGAGLITMGVVLVLKASKKNK